MAACAGRSGPRYRRRDNGASDLDPQGGQDPLFHELTGFYCPGCGGTRAVLALLAGHPVLSFLYHPLVPYCALVALVFAVSYAIYWKTKDPRFRLYLSDAYVHVGLGIIVVNFLVKNYLLAAKGIDILEQLPGW